MKQLLVMIIPLWLLVGCEPTNKPTSGKSELSIYLTTHRHDGHMFVCASGQTGCPSIIHHPTCTHPECGRR